MRRPAMHLTALSLSICAESALALTPAPMLIPRESAVQAYRGCLNAKLARLANPDPAIKDYFALRAMDDESVITNLKTECADVRDHMLQASGGDAGAAAFVEAENQTVTRIQLIRTEQMKILTAIHAPSPHAAIMLRTFPRYENYPPQALRNGEQGDSVATFTIGTDGRTSNCTATGATEVLNMATCSNVQRLLYAPALNAAGQAIPENRTTTVHWRIPNG